MSGPFEIPERHFTLANGKPNKPVLRETIVADLKVRGGRTFTAIRRWLRAARYENWLIQDGLRRNAAYRIKLIAEREDAERICEKYEWSVDRLQVERDAWFYGCSTARHHQLPRYERALKLARERQTKQEAA